MTELSKTLASLAIQRDKLLQDANTLNDAIKMLYDGCEHEWEYNLVKEGKSYYECKNCGVKKEAKVDVAN